ncbi:hypothetical protein P4O66_002276 [Electrophorus voltai]|uniref:Solute carrier family 13 member 4 n=1 Tax=Electrophorus voltai TaxID=2609070 RepID=A0AAD8Z1V6_9TELE|nr:hypothetical protein P4O66_002276 [Electrophorus voltai]
MSCVTREPPVLCWDSASPGLMRPRPWITQPISLARPNTPPTQEQCWQNLRYTCFWRALASPWWSQVCPGKLGNSMEMVVEHLSIPSDPGRSVTLAGPGESSCAYVLIVTAVYWVSEAVPLGAAALVPAFLYPMFGVLKSSEVAAEYFKDTTLLLMGVICLAASIEKWNLHKRIALRMVMVAGAKPGMLVLGFMSCTVFLSMWLSNTSTTAMVMPIAEAVLQQLIYTGIADSHDDSDTMDTQEDESGEETVSKNQFELNRKNSCEKRDLCTVAEKASGFGVKPGQGPDVPKETNGYLTETAVDIPMPKKPKIQRNSLYPTKRDHMICKCLSLSITYAATIGGLITITGTSTNMIFAEQFNNRYPEAKFINFGTWFIFSLPIALVMLVLTWMWLHFLFLGCKKGYRTDATVSVLLGFLLFLIPARKPWPSGGSSHGKDSGDSADEDEGDPLAPMITWKDFLRLMPWEIVILVGGWVSGLSVWIGRQLEPMSGLPPWAVTLLACLLVSAVTEFASNPATLTVFLPILSALSETLQINPLYTLIPATMCVSFGVMLPVGNPPNAIVFSYGHLQISDMTSYRFRDTCH